MEIKNIKNKPNKELIEAQKKISEEFEKVRVDLIRLYDYWISLEKRYNQINNELNNRFGVNNK